VHWSTEDTGNFTWERNSGIGGRDGGGQALTVQEPSVKESTKLSSQD
jgi:hypothetical protein